MEKCYLCFYPPDYKCNNDGKFLCKMHVEAHNIEGGNHILSYITSNLHPQVSKDIEQEIRERIEILREISNEIVSHTQKAIRKISKASNKALKKLEKQRLDYQDLLKFPEYRDRKPETINKIKLSFLKALPFPKKLDISSFLNHIKGPLVSEEDILDLTDIEKAKKSLENRFHLFVEGHLDKVSSIEITQDSKYAITTGKDCFLKIWDLIEMKQFASHKILNDSFSAVGLGKNAEFALIGCQSGNVKLFSFESKKHEATVKAHESLVTCVIVSYDNKSFFSSGADFCVKLHSINIQELGNSGMAKRKEYNFDLKWSIAYNGGINSIALSDDEKYLALASDDNKVSIIDLVRNASKCISEDNSPIKSVAFIPKSTQIVSGGNDRLVKIIDFGKEKSSLKASLSKHEAWINCVIVTNDREYIISCEGELNSARNYKIIVWSLRRYKFLYVLGDNPNSIKSMKTYKNNNNNNILIYILDDGTIRCKNIQENSQETVFPGHSSAVKFVDGTTERDYLITVANDFRIWNTQLKNQITVVAENIGTVLSCCFSSDKTLFAVASEDKVIRVVSVDGEGKVKRYKGHTDNIIRVQFTGDNSYLISKDSYMVKMWNLNNNKVQTFTNSSMAGNLINQYDELRNMFSN